VHKRILMHLTDSSILSRIREALPKAIARNMPRRIVYWCIIRVWAESTAGKWETSSPRKMRIETALDRWKETSKGGGI
jgi:hypothetical protein